MSAGGGLSLDEVVVTTVARKDSEVALLLDQKNAISVVESIGAKELGDLGISDAKTATTKISGVSESEASGDIFVRGLETVTYLLPLMAYLFHLIILTRKI